MLQGVLEVNELSQGGEATVFRVQHIGPEELIIKCPLFQTEAQEFELSSIYDSIIYESQLLKMNPNKDNIAIIREELIE